MYGLKQYSLKMEKNSTFHFLKSIGKAPDNPDMLNYQLVLVEIDCVNKKYRISSMSIYDEKDSVLASLPKPSDEWIDIPPNTQMEILKNEVCSVGKTSKTSKIKEIVYSESNLSETAKSLILIAGRRDDEKN